MADIPFAVHLKEGNSAVVNMVFNNKTVPIMYTYMCETPYGDRYVFRTKEDAKLAAECNSWKYIE